MIHSESVNLMVSFFLVVGIALPFAFNKFNLFNHSSTPNFQDYIERNHLKITKIEKWKNHQIGFDSVQNKLLYQRLGNYPELSLIDLNEIKKISIHEHRHVSGNGISKYEVTDYLGVKLQYYDLNHPAKMLEFYDEKLSPSMTSERSIATKWLSVLQEQIKN
ncbi:hypothetical protein [Algoriphagus sp.]|uniref:hypothetical protein n=1 Tax=Algoriphagus sp. TaxID=1872435 RepID=UPI0025EDAF7F|nr:hypothetical protein [Algoriphagus sp.]